MAVESRAAAKALAATDKTIQNSEYFARLLQLTTSVITNIVVGDCGNNSYEEFYVSPPNENYQGDLKGLVGKHYYNEESKKEEIIKSTDKHLIGKTIKLRTVTHCRIPNKYHVCSNCYGELTWGIPSHYNIGHLASASLTQQLTQAILSLKHIIASASNRKLYLPKPIDRYFNTKGVKFYLNEVFKSRNDDVKIKITQEQAVGFKVLKSKISKILESMDRTKYSTANALVNAIASQLDINIMKISWINELQIIHTVKRGVDVGVHYIKFDIKKTTKNVAFLSLPYLIWVIVMDKWELTDDGDYIMDMLGFNRKKPILELPEREYDYAQLIDEVRKLIRSKEDDKSLVSGPMSLLSKLFTTVNEKVYANIAILEIIIYALTTVDPIQGNYDLPRNSGKAILSPLTTLSKYRSFLLADNDSRRKFYNVSSYIAENKPHSPMDIFLKPNEVLKDIADGTRYSNHY